MKINMDQINKIESQASIHSLNIYTGFNRYYKSSEEDINVIDKTKELNIFGINIKFALGFYYYSLLSNELSPHHTKRYIPDFEEMKKIIRENPNEFKSNLHKIRHYMPVLQTKLNTSFEPVLKKWEELSTSSEFDITNELSIIRKIVQDNHDIEKRCHDMIENFELLEKNIILKELSFRSCEVDLKKSCEDDIMKLFNFGNQLFNDPILSNPNTLYNIKEFKKNLDIVHKQLCSIYEKTIPINKVKLKSNIFNKNGRQSIENKIHNYGDDIYLYVNNMKGEYDSIILFRDDSLLVRKKGDLKYTTFYSLIGKDKIIHAGLVKVLENMYRKNPTIQKLVCNILSKLLKNKQYLNLESHSIGKVSLCINTYLNNQEILKKEGFNILDMLSKVKNFERLDAKMNQSIKKHKDAKYADSIISNKYKFLTTKQSYKILGLLKEQGMSISTLQHLIGSKMAAFTNAKEFNRALNSVLAIHNNFDFKSIKEKAESFNANIIYAKNNIIIIKVNTFEQSSKLGSASWCISRNQVYFNSYTKEAEQYIMYNFNHDIMSMSFLIGITINNKNHMTAAHNKNDNVLEKDNKDVQFVMKEVMEYKKKIAV